MTREQLSWMREQIAEAHRGIEFNGDSKAILASVLRDLDKAFDPTSREISQPPSASAGRARQRHWATERSAHQTTPGHTTLTLTRT